MTKQTKLTPAQNDAIWKRGQNLLVSASAGSGKTYVMIERIKEMIVAGETGVQDILVVTFTKAAASEMKDRLVQKLEEVEPKNEYILEQLSQINASSISTLHSFCAKLLKTYFYVLGLDPSFVLIDELESSALKQKALSKLIDSRFSVGDKEFFELLDIFSINRKEDNFREIILKLYDYMLTLTDSEKWFFNSVKQAYDENLDTNVCAKFISDNVSTLAFKLKKQAEDLLDELSSAGASKLVEVMNGFWLNLSKIKSENGFIKNGEMVSSFERVKSIPAKVDESLQLLKEKVKDFKLDYDKFKTLAEKQFLFDSHSNIKKRLKITRNRVLAIYEYAKNFKEIYDMLKRERVALDFNDLEQFTLKLLEFPEVSEAIKEKYKYVFVDEYQDTNLIQEEILKKITKINNLFMVGDVKQSIYKFRASEPEIFVEKYKKFSSGLTPFDCAINLNHNFRSHQDILNFSNIVFDYNMTQDFGQVDYARDARLEKGDAPYPVVNNVPAVQLSLISGFKQERGEELGPLPVYSVKNHVQTEEELGLKKAECEGRAIVEHIKNLLGKELYQAKTKSTKLIDFSDIAILTSSRGAYLETVLKELDQAKIPYSSDIELGVFEDNFVGTIRSLLEILQNDEQDMHLFAVMNSKMFDFDINDLSEIRLNSLNSRYFYQAVKSSKTSANINAKLKNKLTQFTETVDYLRQLSKLLKVDELIVEVLNKTGFKHKIMAEVDGEKSINLINKLLAFLSEKSYNSNLSKFLDYIKDNSINFGIESKDGGVTVTTIHKSKGLEYPVVILMGAGQSLQKKAKGEFLISKNFGAGIDFYDNVNRVKQKMLVKNAISLEQDRSEKEERLRLLYVALTRAVNHLIVVGIVKDKPFFGSPSSADCFYDWILPAVNESFERNKPHGVEIYHIHKDSFKSNGLGQINKMQKVEFGKGKLEYIKKFGEVLNFKYPYEDLVSMPVKTSVSEILKADKGDYFVPTVFASNSKDAVEKGLAYHKLLKEINLKINSIEALNIEIERLKKLKKLDESDLKLINISDIFKLLTHPEFKEILNGKLYREQEFIALSTLKIKKSSGEVVLQGIVDLIIETDDGLILIDYKTNNSKREEFYVSNYKKQLDIYSEVASASMGKKIIKKLIYSFALGKFIKV